MSGQLGLPNGVERRAYRSDGVSSGSGKESKETAFRLPAVGAVPAPTQQKVGDPYKVQSRVDLLDILKRQIEISGANKYPLCLLMMELLPARQDIPFDAETAAKAAVGVLRHQLRATDLVVRYNDRTLVAVLPECDQDGAKIVRMRIKDAIAIELPPSTVQAVYGSSSKLANYHSTPESLLYQAESAVKSAKY